MHKHTREPIITVLGHVDHGKTSLLDRIRGTVVASREAGQITQHIGATDVPFEVIKQVCGPMLDKLKLRIDVRGLLFIDTPGHAAFTNLRKRGGSVSDIAILVVDINEGFMPQTVEAINILRHYKTPFVVAANKVDAIKGFTRVDDSPEHIKREFYDKFYKLVGALSEHGFDSDMYNNITNFGKQVAIVPVSARTGYGTPELLMVIMGLAQQYLAGQLSVDIDSPGKGTILEVKEKKGLGVTIDVIIYEGRIKRGDLIVVGAEEPIITKVKALLRPMPLDEMSDPRDKFKHVDEVYAASGVRIVAPILENALAGAPVYVGGEELVGEVKKEIGAVEFTRDTLGVIVKADTLGSLEALVRMLEEAKIPIKRGGVGKVNKRDVVEASAVHAEEPLFGVILSFNSPVLDEAKTMAFDKNLKIFSSDVIYRLIEGYEDWAKKERESRKEEFVVPAKIKLMPKHVFRTCKPAIVGVEILVGKISVGQSLMRSDGKVVGRIKEMQLDKERIKDAKQGQQVAMSIEDVTIGRQINEGDVVYSFISNEEVAKIKTDQLSEEELKTLKEIKGMKRVKADS
ncbi:MAG: translation initiation factor IF-2 [Candidatus Altiarchaeales archaeon IMC4]|nr:MAG: translation initiation factor IF-2 [Candidatus Altiarchaeales archaeon IMC4]